MKDNLNLVEKAKGFIQAFESTDVDKMKSYWADDQTIYRVPYAAGMMPEDYEGKDAFHEFTKELPSMFQNIELKINEIIADYEALKVVARTEIELWISKDSSYKNHQIFIFRFNEKGEMIEVSEYFNPVPTAVGLKEFGTKERFLNHIENHG